MEELFNIITITVNKPCYGFNSIEKFIRLNSVEFMANFLSYTIDFYEIQYDTENNEYVSNLLLENRYEKDEFRNIFKNYAEESCDLYKNIIERENGRTHIPFIPLDEYIGYIYNNYTIYDYIRNFTNYLITTNYEQVIDVEYEIYINRDEEINQMSETSFKNDFYSKTGTKTNAHIWFPDEYETINKERSNKLLKENKLNECPICFASNNDFDKYYICASCNYKYCNKCYNEISSMKHARCPCCLKDFTELDLILVNNTSTNK